MKKITPLFALLSLFLYVSCMESSDEHSWRVENEEFMAALADSTGIYPLEKMDSVITVEAGAKYEPIVPTGEYYKVLTQGTGRRPVVGETVKVNYTGKFYDGTVFDSGCSSFDVAYGSIIDGFYLALQRMRVGDRWVVYIPYWLGYGSTTYYYASPSIPAYSALIFDMELREIEED